MSQEVITEQIILPFESKTFHTIYADPPWMERGAGRIKRGADRHYPLMKTENIINMANEIKRVAHDNAHLYLWVTNNFLPDGLEVMKQWGFSYKTMITWVKDRIGLGQYFRGITEHCLFGTRGSLPYRIVDGKKQQGMTLVTAPRTIHSKKPEQMYGLIETVSYPPYLELFARFARTG